MSLSVHLVLGCVVCIVTVVLYRDQLLQVIYLFILPTLDISYITAIPGVGKLFSEGAALLCPKFERARMCIGLLMHHLFKT